ncbi:MAG: hypothetical protein K9J37_12435 [Saprospiraceae bacterium]|nr:hypothetical protein [Saprospiraceae bacterium]MCF8250718.1 hypothetical protein [Saprospiraceae bacterium]MCF8279774.1 hypothetical protein [Bacteroidales bacterium]MCF8310520.1 hypothetical protein [Saprospiraceae bacterium]MCF8440848.1 hypothetical protein [Saprospiraceae bacterium]
MKNFKLLFVLFGLLFMLPQLKAQETADTSLVRIETSDGNEYIGTIVSQDNEVIRLNTATVGTISIKKSMVTSLIPVKKTELKGNEYWFDNPYSTTRYFFNPSGYGLPGGEAYYQNAWILLNQVSFGITDNFSMGVGMVPVFLFALGSGDGATPIWFTPKVSIPVKKDKVNIGIGALYLTVLGNDSGGEGGGIVYGVSTFGPKDNNLSLGLGWGYATGDGLGDRPTISVSYIRRGKPKWAFLTENYYISAGNESVVILSGGARFLAKKISIDFGGMTFLSSEGLDVVPIIPWLSLTVPFRVGGK